MAVVRNLSGLAKKVKVKSSVASVQSGTNQNLSQCTEELEDAQKYMLKSTHKPSFASKRASPEPGQTAEASKLADAFQHQPKQSNGQR